MRKLICTLLIAIIALSSITSFAQEDEASASVSDMSINVYINGTLPLTWMKAVDVDGVICIPAIATAKLLGIDVNVIEFYSSPATVLTKGENCVYFFNDSCYAIINSVGENMEHFTHVINGILYLPYDAFSLFGTECETHEEEGAVSVFLNTPEDKDPVAKEYENTVNSRKITSETDYLIWVSKADFSVRLFTKENDFWNFEKEYPCAIGAAATPTCEGIFKYYEKITAWKYDSYYVGPVMRFNGGYAIHSTLMRYNGTPYDDRVGVKISHGCVRMHQSDVQYLWDTVPLNSTVYVTAE